VQGIVNRDVPQLLVNYTQADTYWLQYTQSRGFLAGYTLTPVPNLEALVLLFSEAVTGVVRNTLPHQAPSWVLRGAAGLGHRSRRVVPGP
jgi:hypothetical protein